jgi:DNA primase
MGRISEQIIEQIRSTADIIEVVSGYVQLKKRGRNYFGLCPFHGEKTASFSVSPERQIYKCFGCSVGGGVINFIMEIEGMEFINAVKHLADQYSIELQIDESPGQSKDLITQLFDIHTQTARTFLKNLGTEEGSEVLAHLESRGLTRDTIKKFQLGYSLKQKDALLSAFRKDGVRSDAMKQSGLFLILKADIWIVSGVESCLVSQIPLAKLLHSLGVFLNQMIWQSMLTPRKHLYIIKVKFCMVCMKPNKLFGLVNRSL